MMVIVLDPPWLKRVYERHKHDGPHNVFQQLVFGESPVTGVVANDKHLQCNL